MEEIYDEVLDLWIFKIDRAPDSNPAHEIFFGITDTTWPEDAPNVTNAIDLCALLSEVFGNGPLTDDDRKTLRAMAMAKSLQDVGDVGGHRHGGGGWIWPNRAGYLLGIVSLGVSGLSWWVLGLIFAVWLCYGAAGAAAQMANREPRPSWELPAIAAMHLVSLSSLYIASVFHLIS